MEDPIIRTVPNEEVEPFTQRMADYIAEELQFYLDAGSERDVTLEELYQPILEHVASWSQASLDDARDDDPSGYHAWLRWKEAQPKEA